jgi:hypothetical protein
LNFWCFGGMHAGDTCFLAWSFCLFGECNGLAWLTTLTTLLLLLLLDRRGIVSRSLDMSFLKAFDFECAAINNTNALLLLLLLLCLPVSTFSANVLVIFHLIQPTIPISCSYQQLWYTQFDGVPVRAQSSFNGVSLRWEG